MKTQCILVSIGTAEGGASGNVENLVEPTTNVGLEKQAIGRITRTSQKHPTTIVRLVTKGTVEEKILGIMKARVEWGSLVGKDGHFQGFGDREVWTQEEVDRW
ncbi:hypothetical protein HDU93_002496 [Gonapodya sp. JEL0774]|nr:hypothetical protein HDU93_002496 [Gonapodya sp. JEL0774]